MSTSMPGRVRCDHAECRAHRAEELAAQGYTVEAVNLHKAQAKVLCTFVCERCKDTHLMTLHDGNEETDRQVMCTHCPSPCERCRDRMPEGGGLPYCRKTPCSCTCHGAAEVPLARRATA